MLGEESNNFPKKFFREKELKLKEIENNK